ncbi:MAG: aminotransferase class V-fold PLP-dependent enzyme [Saprospiraceae bacterium]
MRSVKILGNSRKRESLISFTLEGVHHSDIAMIARIILIAIRNGHHCAQPLMRYFDLNGSLRVSLSLFNTKEEIDYFIEKLQFSIEMLKNRFI